MATAKKVVLTHPRRIPSLPVAGRGKGDATQIDPLGTPLGGSHGGSCVADHPEARNADVVFKSTQQLSLAEKKKLLDQLALEVNGPNKTTETLKSRDLDMWAGAIHKELCKVSGESYGILLVKKTLAPAAAWAPVESFMDAAGFSSCSVVERQGVYNLLAGLLVKQSRNVCLNKGIALSPKFVATCASSVAGVFENAFPGYIASGLAKMVVKQMTALG